MTRPIPLLLATALLGSTLLPTAALAEDLRIAVAVPRTGTVATAGDQVVAINGERVETSRVLVRNIAAIAPGQTVRLSILRDGRPTEIPVQVGRRPQTPQG